jgi:hypothetical protein
MMSNPVRKSRSLWQFIKRTKRQVLKLALYLRNFLVRQRWEFGVCAVFKNESPHLEEWLEFHALVGIDHFFLYDDSSTDDFMTILQPWIDRGHVTLRPSKGRKQKNIYNHCLQRGANRCRWIAFIDIDEFLFNPEGKLLPQTMERYDSAPAVFVHWILFGSNGHQQPPSGGTLDNYTKSLGLEGSINDDFVNGKGGPKSEYVTGWARDGKSIVDPRAVIEMGIHIPHQLAWGSVINETFKPGIPKTDPGTPFSCDILRINHYWSRSRGELTAKLLRGTVSTKSRGKNSLERSLYRETLLNLVDDLLIIEVRNALRTLRTV